MALDIDDMLSTARQRAGLPDPGARGDVHIDGFKCLADSLETDDRLSEPGRRRVHVELLYGLSKYLRFESELAGHPEIHEVATSRPVFIAGFGRTGSTFLHHLLALDPNVRTPQLWELLNPFPPPRPESYRDDPRIAKTRKFLADMFVREPDIPALHPLEAQAPDECHWMMHHGPHQLLRYCGLAYWAWLRGLGRDALKQVYAHYKLQIQHLQLFCRADHWHPASQDLSENIKHQSAEYDLKQHRCDVGGLTCA